LPDTPEVREDLRLYYDEIGRLDEYVGLVLGRLDELGLAENTMVLFITDNGRPFPRDKTTLYDGGIRTPWIVRWPSRIAAGQTTRSLVSAVDLVPTLVELASDASARDATSRSGGLHGQSFAAVLGDPTTDGRRYAFAEDHWHDYEDHGRCIVTQQYKLIRNDYPDLPPTPSADAGRGLAWQSMLKLESVGELNEYQRNCFVSPRAPVELYDLQRDPGELHNIVDDPAYAGVLKELSDALQQWSADTQDYLPSRRTPDEFDRVTGQPDHSVRVRPRPSKLEMFGTNGKY
jgi:arylsulfatase A-like enzyme